MFSEKHLQGAHCSISRFTNDLDLLVNEILQQINGEGECCKLRDELMKICRTPKDSIPTILGKIKTLYISIYRIKYPELVERKSDVHSMNCIQKLLAPEMYNLYQKYYRLVLAEGDVMTTEMLSAFIRMTEATTAKHRITTTMYLPLNLANLDLN